MIACLVAAFLFHRHRKQSRLTVPVESNVTEKSQHDGQGHHEPSLMSNHPHRSELAGQGKGVSTVVELENTSYTNAAELSGREVHGRNVVY
jgi:hypothetical protein